MNIPQIIKHLYPNASPIIDFIVQDDSDGNGPYIASWNLPDPQPTETELQAAWEALQSLPPAPEPLTAEQRMDQLATENADLARELAQAQLRLDQSEQAQADLLLTLVQGGVL